MVKYFKIILITLISAYVFTGCKSEIDGYFERPDYLKGNSYEFLKEKGNYTQFLKALEMTGYKDALDGRGLFSVFAPDDDAFSRYFKKFGKSSLTDFNIDSLKVLISYHIIEYSFNREDFLAFTKTSSAEEVEPGDGSNYKFETLAQEKIKMMEDPDKKKTVKVFNEKKFLPIISTTLLKTQESHNFEEDYKLFFPSIKWQGDKDKLYVANAAVTEAGTPVDNGYIYLVNEVISPLNTVYNNLEQDDDYRVFRETYDRFAYMHYDADITKNYAALGDSLFLFYHHLPHTTGDDLADIAQEWTVSKLENDYESRLKYSYNCFAPKNDVFVDFMNSYFEGVSHYSEVPLLKIYYLLKSHVTNRQKLILPSLIDKGIEGAYGEKWNLKRSNISKYELCSNGVIYGIDRILEPAVFTMVMQPFFKYPYFNTMLNIAHKQGTFTTMVDPEREFTVFAIKDDVLKEKYGYAVDLNGNPESNDKINGRVLIKEYTSEKDHGIRNMSAEEQSNFINTQIVQGYVDHTSSKGRFFYPTREPFHFIYTENGNIYGEDGNSISPEASWKFDYKNGGGRGIVYQVDDKFKSNKENVGMTLFKESNKFQKFYEALLNAKLIEPLPKGVENYADITGMEMSWLKGERVMLFAPTNDAWDETVIPTDSLELDNFLKFFFIPMKENKISDYILPKYGVPGKFDTRHSYSPAVKAKLDINFVDDKRLRITNEGGKSVITDGEIPYFAKDGIIYGITNLLRAKD